MLAVLLLNPNRLVPVESLIKAVWDDDPPDGARHQIQNCAWMLRRRLRDIGVSRVQLIGCPTGYVLHIDDSRLDVAVFDRQVVEARALAAAGQTATASSRLRSALSLWQGPPLSGIPGRIMQWEATQLSERKLSVQEYWIDLEMAIGRSDQVTAELYRLVHVQPFRERIRAQLMLSLHRTGRTAEALTIYQQTRQMFIQELGLEPGPVLKDLQKAILTDDPALGQTALSPHQVVRGHVPSESAAGAFGVIT